jgi:hypothetical protein
MMRAAGGQTRCAACSTLAGKCAYINPWPVRCTLSLAKPLAFPPLDIIRRDRRAPHFLAPAKQFLARASKIEN